MIDYCCNDMEKSTDAWQMEMGIYWESTVSKSQARFFTLIYYTVSYELKS